MKAIIPASADDDKVVDGVVVSSLRPETWLWIMHILISHRIFPLFGLPILLLRFAWFFPAQKVWKELGISEDGQPERKKKRNRRQ